MRTWILYGCFVIVIDHLSPLKNTISHWIGHPIHEWMIMLCILKINCFGDKAKIRVLMDKQHLNITVLATMGGFERAMKWIRGFVNIMNMASMFLVGK